MNAPKITLPTGTEVELVPELWKTASYVHIQNTPVGVVLVPVLLTEEAPQNPVVFGVFSLSPGASRLLLRELDALRQQKPAWLKQH